MQTLLLQKWQLLRCGTGVWRCGYATSCGYPRSLRTVATLKVNLEVLFWNTSTSNYLVKSYFANSKIDLTIPSLDSPDNVRIAALFAESAHLLLECLGQILRIQSVRFLLPLLLTLSRILQLYKGQM